MLWTLSPFAIWGSLSMLTFTNLNLLSLLVVISSRAGVSFLHGPHQLNDGIHLFIIFLLCVAIKNNRNLCLHDNGNPLIYTSQFNHIRMVYRLGKFLFLLLLSCISNRVTICISKNPLLLYYLWLRLLRLRSLGLLFRRGWPGKDGSTCCTLIILSETSELSHVWTLYRWLNDSLARGFRDTKRWNQNILDHHLIYICVTVLYL